MSHRWALHLLLAGLAVLQPGRAAAQTFKTLHAFTATSGSFGTNSDGANPSGGLILSGNTLYGTAEGGGTAGSGTVFAVNTDGTSFTNFYSFSALSGGYSGSNSDGAYPYGGLALSGNTLYGTGESGGSAGQGAVYAISTNGTGFTNFYNFSPAGPAPLYTNSDGANPYASLVASGNILYGTAEFRGPGGKGTVFAIHTDGTGFTNLHAFTPELGGTNSDGAYPSGGVILSGNTLYGTAVNGGDSDTGTVFALNTDGTGFTNLHSFGPGGRNSSGFFANPDGASPYGGLVLSGNTLYGTAEEGGSLGLGTVFAVNTDGTGFTNLYEFTGGGDGSSPYDSLAISGRTLYGTTINYNSPGYGTVFAINTDGTGFTTLYSFTSPDGANPNGVIVSGNTLYGTTFYGGNPSQGIVFSLVIPITLFCENTGTNILLSWNDPAFVLQSAPAVSGTYTNIPGASSPYTNAITGPQRFFRLVMSQ